MVRNTGKPNAPLLPRLNFTPFIQPPLPPCKAVHGDGRLQSVFNSSSMLFLPNYFPLFWCGSSMWAAVLQEKPALAGVIHEAQLLQGVSTCSTIVSSMACPGTSAPAPGASPPLLIFFSSWCPWGHFWCCSSHSLLPCGAGAIWAVPAVPHAVALKAPVATWAPSRPNLVLLQGLSCYQSQVFSLYILFPF